MGLFKKKAPEQVVDLNCPAENCEFVAEDANGLQRHVEWKHPELKK